MPNCRVFSRFAYRFSNYSHYHAKFGACTTATARRWRSDDSADIEAKIHKTPTWNRAISTAEKLIGQPSIFENLRDIPGDYLFTVFREIKKLLGTNHPLLKIAKRLVYNGRNNMQIRALIVLLVANVFGTPADELTKQQIEKISQNQAELARIVELIHTARFVHNSVVNLRSLEDGGDDDDVKDAEYGNKVAILFGDYLLATSSFALSKLCNLKVLDLIAVAIKHFAEGGFIFPQDKNGFCYPTPTSSFREWEKRTFLCSGSLLANGCRSAAVLSNHNEAVQTQAFEFGKQLALAWQVYADIQIFTDENVSPKMSHFDLCSLPFILHAQTDPSVLSTISKNVEHLENLDYNQLRAVVLTGRGLEEAKKQAMNYTRATLDIVEQFPASEVRTALENIIRASVVKV